MCDAILWKPLTVNLLPHHHPTHPHRMSLYEQALSTVAVVVYQGSSDNLLSVVPLPLIRAQERPKSGKTVRLGSRAATKPCLRATHRQAVLGGSGSRCSSIP